LRLLVLFWAAVELIQIGVIAALAVGYRKLQRRLDAGDDFSRRAPRSVTDDGP
jgi:hypothetical protein